jgi:flagellar biosynthesis/type III secretory pathway chaperone
MKSIDPSIVGLFNTCTRLAADLQECFRAERLSLVQFKTDHILENNVQKDQLLQQLLGARERLRRASKALLGDLPPEVLFDSETLSEWTLLNENWNKTWQKLYDCCSENQRFLRHSLRNLDRLSENLSRLFGILSTYSNKGTRVDTKPQGNVVEGRY